MQELHNLHESFHLVYCLAGSSFLQVAGCPFEPTFQQPSRPLSRVEILDFLIQVLDPDCWARFLYVM